MTTILYHGNTIKTGNRFCGLGTFICPECHCQFITDDYETHFGSEIFQSKFYEDVVVKNFNGVWYRKTACPECKKSCFNRDFDY